MYESNMFKSTTEIDFTKFECYYMNLSVSEKVAREICRIKMGNVLYYITNQEIFYLDVGIQNFEFFKQITYGNPKKGTLSNKVPLEARIIGSMLYKSHFLYFKDLGFNLIGLFSGGVYYKNNDPIFVKEIKDSENEDFFITYRGFGPKIYAGSEPGSVIVFIEIRSVFRIAEIKDWKKWINYEVIVKKKFDPNFKGYAYLINIDNENKVAKINYGEYIKEYPIEAIYIPASPHILFKKGVYKDMFGFRNFNIDRNIINNSFEFLRIIFSEILINNSYYLSLDENKQINIEFKRVLFNLEEAN